MMEFSLIDIEKPLGMIPETPSVTPPTINYYEPGDFESKEEGLTQIAQVSNQDIWGLIMITKENGEINLEITNHGWKDILWKF